jgi:hypothetical protein
MREFLAGMITMGFLVAALMFFRYWRRTRDSLFAIFGISFLLFALGQALTVFADIPREEHSWLYLVRLAGFVLLIVGIVAKNVGRGAGAPGPKA